MSEKKLLRLPRPVMLSNPLFWLWDPRNKISSTNAAIIPFNRNSGYSIYRTISASTIGEKILIVRFISLLMLTLCLK